MSDVATLEDLSAAVSELHTTIERVEKAGTETAELKQHFEKLESAFSKHDKANAEIPDLILLDMDLPVVDGWEVARRLKSTDATRPIPVVALTAHAMVGDRDRALEAGCDDYDTKPVEFRRLLEKIRSHLGIEGDA